jgi:hypothetical protein
MCAWNRDAVSNKCLKKTPKACATYYQELKCFKQFSATPFSYKVLFYQVNLSFGESPYFWISLEKDSMDLVLKQEPDISKFKITITQVTNL